VREADFFRCLDCLRFMWHSVGKGHREGVSLFYKGLLAALFWVAAPHVHAAFNNLVPLSYSGVVRYGFGYRTSDTSEAQTTNYGATVRAVGYVWRPWFVTTSAALGFSASKTETQTSSGGGSSTTGFLSFGVFPSSRFPTNISYSRTDSATESFSSASAAQALGQVRAQITRLIVRQAYFSRGGWRSDLWYYKSDVKGANSNSSSTAYGLQSRYRFAKQSIAITASLNEARAGRSAKKAQALSVSLSHSYTPTAEFGVSNQVAYANSKEAGTSSESTSSQAASTFSWSPEHRQLTVSGGVRLTQTGSKSAKSSRDSKGLATQLGLGYRLTRYVYFNANTSLNSKDNEERQSLTSSQRISLRYQPVQVSIAGFIYGWQTGVTASNASTRTDSSRPGANNDSTSTSSQSYGVNIGHSVGRSLVMGKRDSGSFSLSQSGSASESSGVAQPTYGLSHGVGFSWNHRGDAGTLYSGVSYTDSRNFGLRDSTFQSLGANVSSGLRINRLSSLDMNVQYQNSRNGTQNQDGAGTIVTASQNVSGSMAYRHDRPLGIYNMTFSASLRSSKRIRSPVPSTTYAFLSNLNYSLGLLAMSLSYSAGGSAGGALFQTIYFRATRSF